MASYGCELLLEVASPIIFLPSPLPYHDLKEAKDSIYEEDPRPTSSTLSYIMWYQEHLRLGDALLLPLSFCSVNSLLILVFHLILHVYPPLSCGLVLFRVDSKK